MKIIVGSTPSIRYIEHKPIIQTTRSKIRKRLKSPGSNSISESSDFTSERVRIIANVRSVRGIAAGLSLSNGFYNS